MINVVLQAMNNKKLQRKKAIKKHNGQIKESEIVTINIGGTRYEILKTTLQNYPETKLAKLTEQDPEFIKTRKEFFFDRNPELFNTILNFYRTGELHVNGDVCLEALSQEVQFWQLGDATLERCCSLKHGQTQEKNRQLTEFETSLNVASRKMARRWRMKIMKGLTWEKFRSATWQFLDDPFSSHPAKIFGAWTTLLVILSIVTMCFETMPEFKVNISDEDIARIAGITLEDLRENYTWNSEVHQTHVDIMVREQTAGNCTENLDTHSNTQINEIDDNGTNINNTVKSSKRIREGNVSDTHNLNDHNYENNTNGLNITGENGVKSTQNETNINNDTNNRNKTEDTINDNNYASKASPDQITNLKDVNNEDQVNMPICNTTVTMDNTSHSERKRKPINIHRSLSATIPALGTIDMVLNIYFIFELLIRFAVSPNKYEFTFTFYTLSDILAIAPVWIQYIANMLDVENKYKFTLIDVSNCLLIMRVFRAFRLLKHLVAYKVIIYTLKASIKEIILMLLLLILGTLVFGTLIYFSEAISHDSKTVDIASIPIACWYALVTMATVGYGDFVPKTVGGYIIGSGCVVCGVLVISFTVPIIVNNFMLYYNHAKSLGLIGDHPTLQEEDQQPKVIDL